MMDTLAESSLDPLKMRRHSFSLVWLVPMLAVLIGLWVGWLSWSERGFEIEILFKNVSGLEEGKSKVRYRNLDVGTVTKMEFAEDARLVRVRVEMKKGTERFLSKDSRFWVVRARLGVGRVSGLDTLFSGSYIAMDIPTEGRDDQRSFTGLEEPPAASIDEVGSRFRLYAEKRGSVSIGSPVFYRNINVGTVADVQFDFKRNWVAFEVFVREPYDRLINTNTVFWNVSGISATLGPNGVELAMESLETLIGGGLAFDLPRGADAGTSPGPDFLYYLYTSEALANKQHHQASNRFLLYFDESVRGLEPGASVEFSGLRIGEVINIGAEYDTQTLDIRVPVLIEVERKIFRPQGGEGRTDDAVVLATLIKKGLRATLGSDNLLTGKKYVDMVFVPNAPAPKPLTGAKPVFPVIPTMAGGFSSIQNNIASLVHKLDQLPIEALGQNLNKTLESGAGAMVNLEKILNPKSRMQLELLKTLESVGGAAGAIRDLSKMLEDHPQALLFGKSKKGANKWPTPQSVFPQ